MGKWVDRSKCRGWNWQLFESDGGGFQNDQVMHALLMDIRDELQRLNSVFRCSDFQAIPRKLDRIGRNTAKKRKSRAIGKPAPRVVRS